KPSLLRPRVRHPLELITLQKLVAQAAVKGLEVTVLPGPPRGHRDRLRPRTPQPARQRLANEFRPVITPRLADADLAAGVRYGQPLGQVAVNITEQSRHLVGSPSLLHGPLLGTV